MIRFLTKLYKHIMRFMLFFYRVVEIGTLVIFVGHIIFNNMMPNMLANGIAKATK